MFWEALCPCAGAHAALAPYGPARRNSLLSLLFFRDEESNGLPVSLKKLKLKLS
jgi:hypothetical protein